VNIKFLTVEHTQFFYSINQPNLSRQEFTLVTSARVQSVLLMILNPLLSRPVVYCILFVCLSVSSFRKYISSSSLSLLLYLSLSVCLSLLSIRFVLSHCQSLSLIFFASSSCIPLFLRAVYLSPPVTVSVSPYRLSVSLRCTVQ
jgi:hypothetical protein